MHNSAVRAFGGDVVNPEGRDMLPGIAFRSFKGRFEEPVESEGFAGLIKVEFKVCWNYPSLQVVANILGNAVGRW
jgi:hypothetical protein